MTQTRIEFACRFWFPRYDREPRYERGQRLPVADDWRWHRFGETMYWEIPTAAGQTTMLNLPAPFFTFSAASLQRMEWYCHTPGHVEARFRINNTQVFGPIQWRESALWTEVKFDPPGSDAYPNRGPWWLRWRCPDAMDLTTRMMSTLDAIDELVVLGDLPAIGHRVDDMRRELILATLGGTVR